MHGSTCFEIQGDIEGSTYRLAVVNRLEDARLIAGSPEMLGALKAVWGDITSPYNDSCVSLEAGQKMRAAIEKATGGAA